MMQGQRRDPWRPTCSGGCQESSPSVPGTFPARRPSAPACLGWHGIAWAIVGSKDICSPRSDILPRYQRVNSIFVACLFLWINLGAKCQTACKPGSVRTVLVRDGHSSRTRLTARLARPTRTTERECSCASGRCRPYSVLLPVGFTVPPLLPGARCALAAPFRPCPRAAVRRLRGRFVFCGTFPRVAPAGRYPAPYSRGARTFLYRLATAAAVRPSDMGSDGGRTCRTSSGLFSCHADAAAHRHLARDVQGECGDER